MNLLPFPIIVYSFEKITRATPGSSLVSNKARHKTFLFSSSNRGTQRCNGQKSRLSKLLSLVQKQLQKYNIRDTHLCSFPLNLLDMVRRWQKPLPWPYLPRPRQSPELQLMPHPLQPHPHSTPQLFEAVHAF